MRIATVLVSMVLLGSVAAQDTVINIDGAPYSIMLCHGNAMDTSFLFIDSNAVETIALRFCGGTLEEFADEVLIYDGVDDTAPLLYMGSGTFGQMADVLVIATGPAIYLEVITNDSLSCADQAFEVASIMAHVHRTTTIGERRLKIASSKCHPPTCDKRTVKRDHHVE